MTAIVASVTASADAIIYLFSLLFLLFVSRIRLGCIYRHGIKLSLIGLG